MTRSRPAARRIPATRTARGRPSRRSTVAPESDERTATSTSRRFVGSALAKIIAALTALGVLGAIGNYYIPPLLDDFGNRVGRAPLQVSVAFPPAYDTESFFTPMWLLPHEAGSQPADAPTDPTQLEVWQSTHGVMGQDQSLRLTIRGTDDRPVVLQSIEPVIVARSAPLEGWFTSDRGCGGVTVREAHIKLDEEPPTIRFSDGEDEASDRLALILQVTRTDIEVIDVVATSHRSTVDWVLEINYTADGRTGTVRVDHDGKPFRMSGLVDGHAQGYQRSAEGQLERAEWLDPRDGSAGMC
jgi:hypothetical protein